MLAILDRNNVRRPRLRGVGLQELDRLLIEEIVTEKSCPEKLYPTKWIFSTNGEILQCIGSGR